MTAAPLAYTPLAYHAPRCVVCDLSCRFEKTVKLPTPIPSSKTGRKRHCVHAACLERAWADGSSLPLPSEADLVEHDAARRAQADQRLVR